LPFFFIIAETWKQPRCLSIGEWVENPWYSQTMEYHPAIKRNNPWSHETMWRKLGCTLPRERSRSEKATSCRFQLHDILEKTKIRRQ
jgi:hypothetical protein